MPTGDALIFCATSQPVYFSQPGDALVFGGSGGARLIFSATSAAYLPPAGNALIFGCAPPAVEPGGSDNISTSGLLSLSATLQLSSRSNISTHAVIGLHGQASLHSAQPLSCSASLALQGNANLRAVQKISTSGALQLSATTTAKLVHFVSANGLFSVRGASYYAPSWYVPRPLVGGLGGRSGIGCGWNQQQFFDNSISAPHTQAAPKQPDTKVGWALPTIKEGSTASAWNQIPKLEQASAAPWADSAQHPQAAIGCDYSHPAPNNREAVALPWGTLDAFSADNALRYSHPPRNYSAKALAWDQLTSISCQLDLSYSHPAAKDKLVPIIISPYWYPRWCVWQYTAPRGDQLIFRALSVPVYAAPAGLELIFAARAEQGRERICYDGTWNGPKDAYWYQPHDWDLPPEPNIRSFYLAMNNISLKRVSDNVPIPIMDMSISTDMDSWCWSLSANLRRKIDLDLVRPSSGAPVEVEASINCHAWRFIIESYGDDRQFGQYGFSISGRGVGALLAAPYRTPASLLQTAQRSAAQLADEAVADTGFSIDWQLTDWIVPGNIYSVSNQTPIQQLLTIAAAAGGVVHSNPATSVLSIKPWYSHKPWEWNTQTPAAILPTYKTRRTSYQPTPQFNGVYVSGQSAGVTALIKRSGTDGADQPQMVTDPLITATEVALQCGKRILADSGARSSESITAPLLDNPRLLTPGMLIDVVDGIETWRGQVTKCSLSCARPTVTQSINVLRYLGS